MFHSQIEMKAKRTKSGRTAVSLVIIACVQVHSTQLHSAQHDKDTNSAAVILVSPNGDDTGDGREGAPLATIAVARQRIRDLKTSGGLPKGGVVVEMLAAR